MTDASKNKIEIQPIDALLKVFKNCDPIIKLVYSVYSAHLVESFCFVFSVYPVNYLNDISVSVPFQFQCNFSSISVSVTFQFSDISVSVTFLFY